MTISKGNEAGVVVRFDQVKGIGYLFSIDINGNYTISTINTTTTDSSQRYTVLRHGSNGQIKQGLNQANLVAIIALPCRATELRRDLIYRVLQRCRSE